MPSRNSFLVVIDSDVQGSSRIATAPKEFLFRTLKEFERGLSGRSGLICVKNKGDGLFIAGDDIGVVMNIAFELRDRMRATAWAVHGFTEPPGLRIGIDCGLSRVSEEGDDRDVIGGPADTASRIQGVATPGEIWVSNAVREMMPDGGCVEFRSLGEQSLDKNAGRKHLHALSRPWEAAPAPATPPASRPAFPAPAATGAEPVAPNLAPEALGTEPIIGIDMDLLAHGPLSHVFVTLAPRAGDDIEQDCSSEAALAAARMLIEGVNGADPLIECYNGPPFLVQFPEFAFGSSDWDAIDGMIRDSTRQMVVIAGFGAVTGADLLQWKVGASITERTLVEDDQHLGKLSRYNGQWIWIHDPESASTRCWCALKNYREQRHEVHLVDGEGRVVPIFRFNDLLLLPAICADLLYAGARSTRERFRAVLEREKTHKVLITGALYQCDPSAPAWISAINGFVDLDSNRVLVSLANVAVDVPQRDEQNDRWRGLSGVFGRGHDPGGVSGEKWAREVNQTTFRGGVLRCPEPSITIGRVDFAPYSSRAGRYMWEVSHRQMLSPTERSCDKAAVYEVERLTRRYPPEVPTEAQNSGLADLAQRLRKGSPNADMVAGRCLKGPAETAAPTPYDPFDEDKKVDLVKALHCTAHLAGTARMIWSEDGPGVLAYGKDTEVLVWRGKNAGRQYRRLEQLDWPGDRSTLIVFGNRDLATIEGLATDRSPHGGGGSTTSSPGTVVPARPQADITRQGEGAEAAREQWDKPRNVRRAILMDADDIESACDLNSPQADDDLYKKIDGRLKGKPHDQ